MARFLFSPAFKFITEMTQWLSESPYVLQGSGERVLAYPYEQGMRIRNLTMDKAMLFEVSGALVTISYYENDKKTDSKWMAIDEITDIGRDIVKFFG